MTSPLIEIDYALCMADSVGAQGGLTERELDAEAPAFTSAVGRVLDLAEAGQLGFWGLPTEHTTLPRVQEAVAALDDAVTDVLVLGIGGSSLGARAMYQALCGPPELVEPGEGRRRLHLPDNSDPWLLARLLERLDPAHTMAVVTSKSGGTVETAAQMLVVRSWLEEGLGDGWKGRLWVITDPESGALRAMATEHDLVSFEIPPNVGGRFSVLTAVGLVPATLCGADGSALLRGAASIAAAASRRDLRENPAGLLAATHCLQHRLRGRSIHVLMPYADALRPFAAWYVQLWAESLGKRVDRRGRVVETGPTPLPAVGATDQHAQVQLFMEGPRDKLLTFLEVAEGDRDVTIPTSEGAFAYLGGHSLRQLLDYERRGTALALAEDGRPSLTLRIPRVDAESLGALFFLYEAATAFAGELYGIDAFDQPGVELGKQLAYGLLGRPGHEEAGERVRRTEAGRTSRYRVT